MTAGVGVLVALVLMLEQSDPVTQTLLGSATFLALILLIRFAGTSARDVVIAVCIATVGEVLLSLCWGLYEYRSGIIPLYVPFGHGIFYLLAAETSRVRRLEQHGMSIRNALLAVSGSWAVLQLFNGDQWGFLWWLIAAALIARSVHPLLLSLCYVYTFALEIAGTALGNWRWASEVPGFGLTSGNPPSGVGVLYCLLDVSTVAVVAMLGRRRVGTALAAVRELRESRCDSVVTFPRGG